MHCPLMTSKVDRTQAEPPQMVGRDSAAEQADGAGLAGSDRFSSSQPCRAAAAAHGRGAFMHGSAAGQLPMRRRGRAGEAWGGCPGSVVIQRVPMVLQVPAPAVAPWGHVWQMECESCMGSWAVRELAHRRLRCTAASSSCASS